jgi:hypothetical protein
MISWVVHEATRGGIVIYRAQGFIGSVNAYEINMYDRGPKGSPDHRYDVTFLLGTEEIDDSHNFIYKPFSIDNRTTDTAKAEAENHLMERGII